MAYEFTKLTEVEALTEVPENASVFAEVDGEIKRVPGAGLGGENGIKTAIIKDSGYDNMISGIAPATAAAPEYAFSCMNMTFEEAMQTLASGEPLTAVCMYANSDYGVVVNEYSMNVILSITGMIESAAVSGPVIVMTFMQMNELYWTADGISTTAPSEGK